MSTVTETANGTVGATSSKRGGTCSHLHKLVTASGAPLESILLRARTQHLSALSEDDAQKHVKGLGVVFACLQCSESGSFGHITSHSKKEKHRISWDLRSGCLFCSACRNPLYDRTAEHIHIYGTPPGDESKKRKLLEALDSDSYVQSNSWATCCGRQGVRGLFNLGQTCYMNAVVQSLVHDPLLVSYFLGEGHPVNKCEIDGCIGCAMTETFTECRAVDQKHEGYAPCSLLYASWKNIPSLAGYAQQDAHEYYQALVDKLHESATHKTTTEEPCKCFFHKAFFGRLRSTIKCTACGEERTTDDPINDLSLHMEIQQVTKKNQKLNGASGGDGQKAPPTLESCLDNYTAKEKLVTECKKCGSSARPGTKQLKLRKLPAILCMQMKRFDNSKTESSKIEGKVDFPLSLDMKPYTTSHGAISAEPARGASASSTTSKPSPAIEPQRLVYDLASVIVHRGTLDSGHYFAYCRDSSSPPLPNTNPTNPNPSAPAANPTTSTSNPSNPASTSNASTNNGMANPLSSTHPTLVPPPPIPPSQSWYLFNDDRVTPVPTSEVLAADAYLLFYGLRWLPPRDPARKAWDALEGEEMGLGGAVVPGGLGSSGVVGKGGAVHRVDLESDSE